MSIPSSQTPSPELPPAMELLSSQFYSFSQPYTSNSQLPLSTFNGHIVRNSSHVNRVTLQGAKQAIDHLSENILSNAELSDMEWRNLSEYFVVHLSQIAGRQLFTMPQQQEYEGWHQELQSIGQQLLSIKGNRHREKKVKDALKKMESILTKTEHDGLKKEYKKQSGCKVERLIASISIRGPIVFDAFKQYINQDCRAESQQKVSYTGAKDLHQNLYQNRGDFGGRRKPGFQSFQFNSTNTIDPVRSRLYQSCRGEKSSANFCRLAPYWQSERHTARVSQARTSAANPVMATKLPQRSAVISTHSSLMTVRPPSNHSAGHEPGYSEWRLGQQEERAVQDRKITFSTFKTTDSCTSSAANSCTKSLTDSHSSGELSDSHSSHESLSTVLERSDLFSSERNN